MFQVVNCTTKSLSKRDEVFAIPSCHFRKGCCHNTLQLSRSVSPEIERAYEHVRVCICVCMFACMKCAYIVCYCMMCRILICQLLLYLWMPVHLSQTLLCFTLHYSRTLPLRIPLLSIPPQPSFHFRFHLSARFLFGSTKPAQNWVREEIGLVMERDGRRESK